MPSHQRNHTAVIRWLLFACLLPSGSSLEAQVEAPTPVPTQEAPSKSNETSDDSELKIHNYQLKHAKAIEVLKLFKQLHGVKNVATVDERTNSIVFLANETNARELRESLALLDGDAPIPIIPPTPVVQGSSPEVRVPNKFESPNAKLRFRKFTFKHAKVADVVKILRELTGANIDNENMEGFAVDERTNSVIWKADEWVSQHWEETLLTLDGESSTSTIQKTPSPYAPMPASVSAQPTQTFTFSMGFERGESIETLKQRYNELEQRTHVLAEKLRQSMSLSESDRTELQAAVRKSFEARQALQRAELADLAQRMKSMQQSIDMRDKLADKVVEKRVEDLLNPNLKWDAGKVSEQLLVGPNQGSSNPARPLPPSALPSNVSAPYVPGEPPATVIRKRIQGRWIVQTHSVGNSDALADLTGQMEVDIDGNLMRYLIGKQDTTGPIFLTDCKEVVSPTLTEEDPLPIDFIYDPNGDPQTIRGIIACDGTTLSICMASDEGRAGRTNKDFRPSLFVPGTKVTLIKCRRAEPETANAVSVDQTTWKSAVQQATSKLLLAHRVPPNSDPTEGPKIIALIDIDYQGKQEAGELKEEIYEWIANDVPVASPGRFTLLSRRFVVLAMMETQLTPSELAISNPSFLENRRRFLEHIRRHDVKLDSLLITSLKHMGDSDKTKQNQFELTLEGFIDAQTSWFERVTLNGKANGPLKEPESNSLRPFATPQELLAAVDQYGKSGSYEDFVKLFNDGGARDLAGNLLMQAVVQTSIAQQLTLGVAEVDPDLVAFRKVLQRWLPRGVTTAQQEAMGKGLSTMMSSIGGAAPDQTAMHEFVTSIRESVGGISDHRKFSIEIMRAFETLTERKFVYFGHADHENEWQISQFGDRAIATLIDGAPGMATTITLQQSSGNWNISSLFNEVVKVTNEFESGATPIIPAMEMQQRLQGEWDVKIISFSAGDPKELVIRDDLLLLPGNLLGKQILTSMKLEWPNPNQLDEVDIIWEPNDQQPGYAINRLVGRIRCDGEKLQLCFVSGSGKVTARPRIMCGGDGIFYLECTRKKGRKSLTIPERMEEDAHASTELMYSGHTLSWWLDSYWDNATASPKSPENSAQEYVASEAIRKLCEKPECKGAIEDALAKWFASVEHEVNETQLTRAAKCIVTIAGPTYQETAVNLLFKIWKHMPLLTHEQLVETADDASELNQLLSQLMLNDQLAIQFADRLTNGNSTDRSLVIYGLLSLMGRLGAETHQDLTELENWLRKNAERLAPAIEAASKDENEHIRFTALIQLATLIHATKLEAECVRLPTILSTAASDASPDVRYIAIELLTSKEFAPAVKLQSAQIIPKLISAIESDSSNEIRYSALNALMQMNVEAELVHKTLMEWAKSGDSEKVKNALMLTLRDHQTGDRPQSIDELVELLSDPEWGTTVEVRESNWSNYHRWARQYAIAILGRYAAHAHRAIPTLEAELARNNKDTLSFATEALDSVRGYCPDLPIDKLQGDWEFVSIQKAEGSSPFLDLQSTSDQQPPSVITISGTQLKLGNRVLAELSHYRSGSRQGLQLLLDPNDKKLHCNGRYDFNSEFLVNGAREPEWLKIEIRGLFDDLDTREKSKQIYEFRPLNRQTR